MAAPDRASNPARVPDLTPKTWVSPWPVGHPNHTHYVSPEQQTANARGKKPIEYRTEPDITSQEMPSAKTETITKSAYQAAHGWVSPWPAGHPNHTPMVTREEQTRNVRR